MKKLFLILLLCLPALADAGMSIAAGQGEHTHSDASTGGGTLTLGGTLSSTKACAAGYTRVGPNFCWKGDPPATSLTDGVCTSIAAAEIAAGAKGLILQVYLTFNTQNAFGMRDVYVQAFDNAGCTGNAESAYQISDYEEVARASALLGIGNTVMIFGVPAGLPKLRMSTSYGGTHTGSYSVAGYFD